MKLFKTLSVKLISKNTFICLLLLVASVSTSQSQTDTIVSENSSKFIISISAGVCFPVGKFSKFEKNYIGFRPVNYAGEANTGIGAGVDLKYGIGKHFGVAGSLYGSVFKAGIADFINTAGTGQEYGPEVEPGNWMIAGFLAGLQYQIGFGKINMAAQALVGIQKSNSPEVRYKSYFLNPGFPQPIAYETEVRQPSLTSMDPAYRIGLITTYPFKERKLLALQVIYTSSSGNFNGKDIEIKSRNNRYDQDSTYYVPLAFTKQLSFLSVLLGISFRI